MLIEISNFPGGNTILYSQVPPHLYKYFKFLVFKKIYIVWYVVLICVSLSANVFVHIFICVWTTWLSFWDLGENLDCLGKKVHIWLKNIFT